MRKVINQFKRTVRVIGIAAAFLTALAITYGLSKIPTHYYYTMAAIVFVGLCLWRIIKVSFQPDTYINKYGYVVLSKSNELEHRYLATQKLGRDLKPNEIVHHINGKKTDNKIDNLCVMDREKHELFHAWLSWTKRKKKSYPPFNDQKRLLVDEYGGTLLSKFVPEKFVIGDQKKTVGRAAVRPQLDFSKKLFHQLRRERKRIADEKQVPVYVIFHNNTLSEMADRQTDTEESMSRLVGMTPLKLKLYGASFIAVIKKFKHQKNQDSA